MEDGADRLHSWKEIAAYLNRGVRSVQRWEKTEGLPVHRLHHDRLGSVYAYKSELDAWWASRASHLAHESLSGEPKDAQAAGERWSLLLKVLALTGAVLAGATLLAVAVWVPERDRQRSAAIQQVQPVLKRVTSDTGLTTDPVVSPHGNLLVYASDRSQRDNLDLWVHQLAPGGQAARITDHSEDDYQPSFSPDGSRIVFRSERDGGGIYVVPVVGGEPVLLVREGRNPRFSPDGRWVAYWAGTSWGPLQGVVRGSVFVIAAAGGPPHQVAPSLDAAAYPMWLPDSKHLILYGKQHKGDRSEQDWWVAPASGGEPTGTTAFSTFRSLGISLREWFLVPFPADWVDGGLLFSAKLGDSVDIWQVPFSLESRHVSAPAQRLGTSTRYAVAGSAAPNSSIFFASLEDNAQIWTVPVDPDRGLVTGVPERLTNTAGAEYWPSISANGRTVAYTSLRSGNRDIWAYDLTSRKEIPLAVTAAQEEHPRVSTKGDSVAYSRVEDGKEAIFIHPLHGAPERVCDGCGGVWAWSNNGRYLIHRESAITDGSLLEPHYFRIVDLSTKQAWDFLRSRDRQLFQATFSPDDEWIAFNANGGLFVIPFRPRAAVAESEWIRITDGVWRDDKPRWSPDGGLIYFSSDRDAARCIWAQRVDVPTKKPQGEPFAVYHAHHVRRSMRTSFLEIGLGGNRLVFTMSEITGNVWMRGR
jgi:Tol biopolymer transport system component